MCDVPKEIDNPGTVVGAVVGGPAGAAFGGLGYDADIGGGLGNLTGSKDRERIADARRRALAELRAGFEGAAPYLDPYLAGGDEALARLRAGFSPGGDFTGLDVDVRRDPSYGLRLQEGLDAIEGSAAARGTLLSGQTLRGLQDYAQNYASREYQSAYDREADQQRLRLGGLFGLTDAGYGAASNLAQLRSQLASNLANTETGTAAAMNQVFLDRLNPLAGVVSGVGQAALARG